MLNILIKTLGLTFYKQHAGLFLVFFYLLFGMIQGYDLINFHIALLISICASPANLILLFSFWLLYTLKCIHFLRNKLIQDDYRFAKTLTVMSLKSQSIVWLRLYAFLLLPMLIYTVPLFVIAIKNQYYASFLGTLIGLFFIFGIAIFYTLRFTNYAFNQPKALIKLPIVKFNKPFWTWPIFYLLNEQRLVFLICKIVSLVFFKAILLVFADVGVEVRVYLTAILAVILSHAILILNLVKFDASYLSFAKNLPISASKRFTYWLIVFAILLLPELSLLVVITEINVLGLFYCLIFAIGGMLFLKMLVYNLKADIDRYIKYLLFFFFLAMLAILSKYYLIFSLLMIASSVSMFLSKYNKTELKDLAE